MMKDRKAGGSSKESIQRLGGRYEERKMPDSILVCTMPSIHQMGQINQKHMTHASEKVEEEEEEESQDNFRQHSRHGEMKCACSESLLVLAYAFVIHICVLRTARLSCIKLPNLCLSRELSFAYRRGIPSTLQSFYR